MSRGPARRGSSCWRPARRTRHELRRGARSRDRRGRGLYGRDEGRRGAAMTMTHAVVLIEAERDALSSLGGALADIEGVAEAYSVTGEWDFVAIVRVPDHEQLADVVTAEIGGLAGGARTPTRGAVAGFSRHDLESLFSIGE